MSTINKSFIKYLYYKKILIFQVLFQAWIRSQTKNDILWQWLANLIQHGQPHQYLPKVNFFLSILIMISYIKIFHNYQMVVGDIECQ